MNETMSIMAHAATLSDSDVRSVRNSRVGPARRSLSDREVGLVTDSIGLQKHTDLDSKWTNRSVKHTQRAPGPNLEAAASVPCGLALPVCLAAWRSQ
jgi:hypothetical protein